MLGLGCAAPQRTHNSGHGMADGNCLRVGLFVSKKGGTGKEKTFVLVWSIVCSRGPAHEALSRSGLPIMVLKGQLR